MQKTDIDTVTNVILNNEYKLHENEEINNNNSKKNNKKNKKRKKKKTLKQKIFLVLNI